MLNRLLHTLSILLLLSTLASASSNHGTTLSANEAAVFVAKIKSVNSSVESITSDFTQRKTLSLMSAQQISSGKFYFQRQGNKICLDYTNPASNRVVITDNEFAIQTSGKTQTTSAQNPALMQMRSLITCCVTGDFTSLADEAETSYFIDDNLFTIVIAPQNKRLRRYIATMTLRFRQSDCTLFQMTIDEPNGDTSTYEYTNVKNNVAISSDHFKIE